MIKGLQGKYLILHFRDFSSAEAMKCLKNWVKSGKKSLKYFRPTSTKKSHYISERGTKIPFLVLGILIHIARASTL